MLPGKANKELMAERRRSNPAMGFGTAFAAGMLLFSLGGHWLDVRLDREPLFTLIGIFLGFVFGGWELYKLVTSANQRIADEERKQRTDEEDPLDETKK